MISSTFLIASLLGICLATPHELEKELEPLSDAQISYINKVQSSWTAGRNFKQEDYELIKKRLGNQINKNKRDENLPRFEKSDVKIRNDLPEEFDARKKWPHCKSIGEIRDTSRCASSWALAPAEALTDRFCIHNKTMVHLSAEDVTGCVPGEGCNGGSPLHAWNYFLRQGVVTGGNYNSSEGCMPYSLPPCNHFESGGKYPLCPSNPYQTPKCTKKCRKGYGKTYEQDKYFAHPLSVLNHERAMMQELVDNGPITTSIDMYDDFFNYKSGVYKHVTGLWMGVLNFKIVGYGIKDGYQKYWLAANNWNDGWGDKGFFKIAKGNNECRVETEAVYAMPKV